MTNYFDMFQSQSDMKIKSFRQRGGSQGSLEPDYMKLHLIAYNKFLRQIGIKLKLVIKINYLLTNLHTDKIFYVKVNIYYNFHLCS